MWIVLPDKDVDLRKEFNAVRCLFRVKKIEALEKIFRRTHESGTQVPRDSFPRIRVRALRSAAVSGVAAGSR